MKEIKRRLINILKENNVIDNSSEELFSENGLNVLEINSMTFIRIIIVIEEEFDIEFDDLELDFQLFGSLDDLVKLIQKKLIDK